MRDRPAYMGPRLRRLRRDLGLTQPGMAQDLGVSVSYVSLLESNQRPVTADLLLRLARTYRIDMADFAGDGGVESTARLQAALRDPLFADIDLPALQSADVATNFPGFTEAFLRLHTAYHEEQRALADRAIDGGEATSDPPTEVRLFLRRHRNAFPVLDERAAAIAAALGDGGGGAYLADHHRLRVRVMPPDFMAGMVRRHDPHHAAVFLDEALDAPARAFQLALQIAYLELGDTIAAIVADHAFGSENARRLARRALASHAAGAIRMPYPTFVRAVDAKRHDIEALARQFGTSFEQTAHRLATLSHPGEARVPFFLVRIDAAGNVSKRLDGAGFPHAGPGGGCPLWSLHQVFARPGEVLTQWLEFPDGQRFFSIARTVEAGGGGHDALRIRRAVALVCGAEDARQLAYADRDPPGFMPVGIACPLCQRDHCAARAAPPIGRQILADDHHRRRAPYGFADDTA